MDLQFKIQTANAIVLAQSFNPSLIKPLWLTKQKIVVEEDLGQAGAIFTDIVAQIPTTHFSLLVTPDRLQFTPTSGHQEIEPLHKLVNALPHTPYRALGLNFIWQSGEAASRVIQKATTELFRLDTPLYKSFDDGEPRYGAYMSRDFDDRTRMRLNAKPVKAPNGLEAIQFAFNFHTDLAPEEGVKALLDRLGRWSDCREATSSVMETLHV